MFIKVDLPQPEGPTMATNSPSATLKLTSSITGRLPLPEAKLLRMPLTDDRLSGHSAISPV